MNSHIVGSGKSLLLAALVGTACMSAAEPSGEVFSDGEIAKVLTTLNEGEIEAANIELKHGQSHDAKDFAKMMIDEHAKNMATTKTVAKKNSLGAKESELSRSLSKEAKNANQNLKASNEAVIDKAYVKEQIKMHQDALNMIDKKLVPNVKNPELKEHLLSTRTAVAAHLDHAKELQSKF